YWAQLKLVNDNPIQFALVASGPQSPEPYDCNSPLIDPSTSSTTGQFQQSGAWKTAAPAQVGVSSQLLDLVTSQLNDGTYTGIDSVLAIKCGFLIYEQYFNGYHSNAVHDLRSTTKSITSGLVGIAIDKGFIESVDLKVAPFLAAYPRVETWTETQQQMTIEDLLTMRSGQYCNDSDTGSPGNEQFMYSRYNWVQFFTEIPPLHPPGTFYSYCTAGVVALGGVLDSATGLRTDFFAQRYLFDDLQISNYYWEYMPSGHVDTGGHMHMTPRDMARFGQLYLQRGRWGTQQLISQEWIDRTNGQQVVLNEDWYYGYLWRERTFEITDVPVTYFYTQGNGGQFIYVVPALDMIIVFTGSNYNQSNVQVFNIKNDIIAADL
ncbi:MAG: beta-lactamase family protein, partial [Pseudomonadales bacterium]|nr:beta-lactamase family protein [Pseudomonadales bacterium]